MAYIYLYLDKEIAAIRKPGGFMFYGSCEPNDCEVGVIEGKLFITGITRCCHGNIINKTTMWFSPELIETLQHVINYDDLKMSARPHWN